LVDDKPIGVALNRNLGSPTAPGEAVEAELNRLIERRSRRKDPEEESELWKASVGAYTARKREEMRAAWCEHHQGQAARLRTALEELLANHETQAERYRDKPKGVT
jgi:type II secretory ATPase GspE/PulE/Tfp pilus assembly ATPase PilB-like protein